jgi:8-oxo-dGTP pyrophosphatase MutT (NUDIX family)
MPERTPVTVRQIATREVFANARLRIYEDEVEYPDGARSTYTVVERRDFVVVLAVSDGGLWLVEQFRYPLGERFWELPQGTWTLGRDGSADELARAELAEETGLNAAQWQHVGRLVAGPGWSRQRFDVYLASGLSSGEPDREPSEADMRHAWFPMARVRAMIADGEIVDANTVAALGLFDAVGGAG